MSTVLESAPLGLDTAKPDIEPEFVWSLYWDEPETGKHGPDDGIAAFDSEEAALRCRDAFRRQHRVRLPPPVREPLQQVLNCARSDGYAFVALYDLTLYEVRRWTL